MLRSVGRRNVKGQFTIVTLIGVVVTLIVYSVLYPVLNDFLQQVIPISSPEEQLLLKIIPFMILLMIILSAMYYIAPYRTQGTY